jgi:hypothetical protein
MNKDIALIIATIGIAALVLLALWAVGNYSLF